MDWQHWVGIYGAGLSTLLAWRGWRKDRRSLKITAVPAINLDLTPKGSWIRVSLANPGFEPVHLRSASVHYRTARPDLGWFGWRGLFKFRQWHRSWWFTACHLPDDAVLDPTLPATVNPGRNIVIWLPSDALRAMRGKAVRGDVRLFVQDELDRSFASQRLPAW